MWLWLWLACGGGGGAERPAVFVRGGLIESGGDGRPIGDGRRLRELAWEPGAVVETAAGPATAPAQASCVRLGGVELGDVARRVVGGAGAPDTALAFSPDGRWLAVGSFLGELLVLDAWTGELRARRSLATGLVKQVAWTPDGATLLAAEQSPDAFVRGLDPATLEERWRLRLADEVGSSPPPPGDDLFGVYTLPGAYGLLPLADGWLVSAVHAWNTEAGRRNASRLLWLGPDGAVRARWPELGVADATLMHPAVSGDRVLVPVGRSAAGEAPPGLAAGSVLQLRLREGRLVEAGAPLRPEPLEPHFREVFVWEGLDVRAEAALVATTDGRVLRYGGGAPQRIDLGTPVMAGDVPIYASIGHARLVDEGALVLTSATSIPFGAQVPDWRPPEVHAGENTLWSLDPAGAVRWRFRGPWQLGGIALPEGRSAEVVIGAGPRTTDARADLFGALVVDRASGALITACPTEGPVFFRFATTTDGRIAVAEHPFVDEGGAVRGAYRVSVLR